MKRIIILLLILIFLLPTLSHAAIPHLINYQGKLTDSAGNPIAGTRNITFRIYEQEASGSAVWSETQNSITVDKGIFSVLLGGVTALNLSFDKPYWLSIQVESDPEMTPRQRITSSGYAFRAEHGVPKGTIVMWAGTIASIPAGWALCDGTNGTPDLRNKFVKSIASGSTNPGTTGGNATVTLTEASMPPHKHTGPAHNHNIRYLSGAYAGGPGTAKYRLVTGDPGNAGNVFWTSWDTSVYAMDNSGTDLTGAGSGSSTPVNIAPPYYEIAFIMKVE